MSKAKIPLAIIVAFLFTWLSIYNPPILTKSKLSVINLFRFPLRLAQSASYNVREFIGRKLYSKWIRENKELKDRVGRLSYEITKLKELETENRRLKKLLDFKNHLTNKNIPARIIGADSALLSKSLLIDKGIKDGITVGMAVISEDGLVGKITEINSHISRVMLLEDPNLRLGVVIQRTREQGLFIGGPHRKAKVIYLQPNSDVKEGDEVVSYSSSKIFPKGLLIGYIKNVSDKSDMYKSATVQIAVNYSRLEEVVCIK